MEGRVYLEHAQALFRAIKRRGERALAQVSDEQFFAQLDGESNSLAVLVKHVAGNARSRWTDFLTTDGEKPDRHRDEEFVVRPGDTRERLLERWEAGWGALFETLAALSPEHLAQEVLIRREPHTVFEALERQKEHYAYHVGQMVFLAKHLARSGWQSLSVALGASEAYNATLAQDRLPRPPGTP